MERPHDGIVYREWVYYTTVDGHVVVADLDAEAAKDAAGAAAKVASADAVMSTSVDLGSAERGRLAADLLLKRIDRPNRRPRTLAVEPHLVVRDSSEVVA